MCRPGYRAALIEMAVVSNAALAAYTLNRRSAPLTSHGMRAAYGVYLVEDAEDMDAAPRTAATARGLPIHRPISAAFGDFRRFRAPHQHGLRACSVADSDRRGSRSPGN